MNEWMDGWKNRLNDDKCIHHVISDTVLIAIENYDMMKDMMKEWIHRWINRMIIKWIE